MEMESPTKLLFCFTKKTPIALVSLSSQLELLLGLR